ncbi:MAG: glycerophosphodiester phosphodiesterase [Terriglobales bacterium]
MSLSETAPLCLGHRGHRCPGWPEPENSLAAFDRALASGCDGLELDLRLSGDGRVVVHHDAELRYRRDTIPIAHASLRSLRRLHPQMATLDQVLRRYRDRTWLDLEIKAPEAVPTVAALLHRWPPQCGYVVSSFDPAVLAHMAQWAPAVPLCLNLKRPTSLRRLRQAKVGWIAPQQSFCTAWYVKHLRRHGWQVLVWTVNHPARMRLLTRAGAAALCSDLPALLVNTTRSARAASFQQNESGDGDEPRRHSRASRAAGRMVSEP